MGSKPSASLRSAAPFAKWSLPTDSLLSFRLSRGGLCPPRRTEKSNYKNRSTTSLPLASTSTEFSKQRMSAVFKSSAVIIFAPRLQRAVCAVWALRMAHPSAVEYQPVVRPRPHILGDGGVELQLGLFGRCCVTPARVLSAAWSAGTCPPNFSIMSRLAESMCAALLR